MCRNIKTLFNLDPVTNEEEIRASALQYVRKISGMRSLSAANTEAVERAVEEITAISSRLLLEELTTRAAPKSRERLAEQAKQRGARREARMRERILSEPA